ncbi:AbiH family protein [Lactococcus lactis]
MGETIKLYIVGNGFNLSHGLKTSYKDFSFIFTGT